MLLLFINPLRNIYILIIKGFKQKVKDNNKGGHYKVVII